MCFNSCIPAANSRKEIVLSEIISEELNVLLFAVCPFVLAEAREAFIKQFSLLEASAGSLLAQLNGITTTLNCSISMTEMESGTDGGSGAVCQAFTDTLFIVRASQKQLKQATLDLDSMVGESNTPCPH